MATSTQSPISPLSPTCDNRDTLTRWIDRAITAASIAEVFAEAPADQEDGQPE